jgi:hypothetical protein
MGGGVWCTLSYCLWYIHIVNTSLRFSCGNVLRFFGGDPPPPPRPPRPISARTIRRAQTALTSPPSRPNAMEMHRRITSAPSPTGIHPHADHTWSTQRSRPFFGHSFTAPTPSISTIQLIGLCLSKSFAAHVRYATLKFCDHHPPVHTTRHIDSVPDPTCVDHPLVSLRHNWHRHYHQLHAPLPIICSQLTRCSPHFIGQRRFASSDIRETEIMPRQQA